LYGAWPPPGGRWLGRLSVVVLVLAAFKLALGLAAPQYGLRASYYFRDSFGGAPERSTMLPSAPYTRIDNTLDFGGDEFPLYFFNDSLRFNDLGPNRLDRGRDLTWSARWSGYLNVPADTTAIIWLTASGPGELSLDGRPLLKVDAEGRATSQAEVQLSAGSHPLDVRYARKKERSGYLQVSSNISGKRELLGGTLLVADPYPVERLALDRYLLLLAMAVDVAFLAALAAMLALAFAPRLRAWHGEQSPSLRRALDSYNWPALGRPLLALVPLGFFLQASLPRLDRVGKMVFLGGGQDWLTYETMARDIQLNGPLMTLGEPVGRGAVLLNQPLYPYYLALLHALAGEDLFGVTALQVLGLGVASILVFELARRLFGQPTALVALALTVGVLVPFELGWVARRLLTEAPYFWLIPAAVLAMLALVGRTTPRLGLAVLSGLLLGLACLSRGPTLLYLPPAGLLVWLVLRRNGSTRLQASSTLAVVAFFASVLIALVPLRNWIVAGRPVLTAASGGNNLLKFHRPPPHIHLRDIDTDPLQRMLNVDRPTREVIEFVRQDPVGYFGSYLPLAAYTLGVGSALNHLVDEPVVQLHLDLLILSGLYVLAVLFVARARSLESCLLHAFIALHFATMVVFAPYDYENRLVMPMYLFVTVFAAAALTGGLVAVRRSSLRVRLIASLGQSQLGRVESK
jgi:hypothetical protein